MTFTIPPHLQRFPWYERHQLWLARLPAGERANLTGADLTGVDFTGANLTDAIFIEANLTRANLSMSDCTGSNFEGANLAGAYFHSTNLADTAFQNANLTGAALQNANLTEADLQGTGVLRVQTSYEATVVPGQGEPMLYYGCEIFPISYWESNVGKVCARHEPEDAERYEAEIRAIIALYRTLPQPNFKKDN